MARIESFRFPIDRLIHGPNTTDIQPTGNLQEIDGRIVCGIAPLSTSIYF